MNYAISGEKYEKERQFTTKGNIVFVPVISKYFKVSSQLMEAVQQKVILSEKLKEMEVNMVSFLQMKNKLSSDTSSDSDGRKETLSSKISRKIFRR